jgi:hypothetical protein
VRSTGRGLLLLLVALGLAVAAPVTRDAPAHAGAVVLAHLDQATGPAGRLERARAADLHTGSSPVLLAVLPDLGHGLRLLPCGQPVATPSVAPYRESLTTPVRGPPGT